MSATDAIARVCHEANRGWCEANGDFSQKSWDLAEDWQRQSACVGVKAALEGCTSEELHESWCRTKVADGWAWGATKDADAKTHPCLVPYADLPAEQQRKDALFGAVVRALSE